MKIKRYFAPDIRQAIRMVREEQGPDAVILSNRKVDGGVEIVAARDFDEQVLLDRTRDESRGHVEDDFDLELNDYPETTIPSAAEVKRRTETTFRDALNKFSGMAAGGDDFRSRPAFSSPSSTERRGPYQDDYGFDEVAAPRKTSSQFSKRVESRNAGTTPKERPYPEETSRRSPQYRMEANPAFRGGDAYADEAIRRPVPLEQQRIETRLAASASGGEMPRKGGAPQKRGESTEIVEDYTLPPQPKRSQGTSRTPESVVRSPESARSQEAMKSQERVRSQASSSPAAPGIDGKMILDMQRELRQMRQILDMHLTEMGWQSAARRSPIRLDLLRRLSELGFSKSFCLNMADRLKDVGELDTAWQQVQSLLARELPVADEHLLDYGGIAVLVGPTGVGKTTTIAKLAANFRIKHGPRQIALITIDNYRIAAHEQLTTYGRILDVPVRGAASVEELHHLLNSFYDRRLILIDTAGMGQRDQRLAEQMALLSPIDLPIKTYLVLSAASQLRTMQEAIEAFQGFSPEACILTKLDETAQLGAAISAVNESRLPLAFLCDGQQIPEDLHVARSQLLLSQCFAEHVVEEDHESRSFSYEDWVTHASV